MSGIHELRGGDGEERKERDAANAELHLGGERVLAGSFEKDSFPVLKAAELRAEAGTWREDRAMTGREIAKMQSDMTRRASEAVRHDPTPADGDSFVDYRGCRECRSLDEKLSNAIRLFYEQANVARSECYRAEAASSRADKCAIAAIVGWSLVVILAGVAAWGWGR